MLQKHDYLWRGDVKCKPLFKFSSFKIYIQLSLSLFPVTFPGILRHVARYSPQYTGKYPWKQHSK
ncbi:hypothetical protein EVD33_02670 [Bacteroidales bacterium SW292]|nr:hypothetical protein [Bacteroidales bacterium SW292]